MRNQENVEQIAGNIASQKRNMNIENNGNNPEGLTTGEDLLSGYQENIVKLSTGKTFKIQSIALGNFFIVGDNILVKELTKEGIDLSDQDKIKNYIDNIPDNDKVNLLDDKVLYQMKRICCLGVTSINFSMEIQSKCQKGTYSIHLLSIPEVCELFGHISNLSLPQGDVENFQSFREESLQESTQ